MREDVAVVAQPSMRSTDRPETRVFQYVQLAGCRMSAEGELVSDFAEGMGLEVPLTKRSTRIVEKIRQLVGDNFEQMQRCYRSVGFCSATLVVGHSNRTATLPILTKSWVLALVADAIVEVPSFPSSSFRT